MAEEQKVGYVYVNSCTNGYDIFKSLRQSTARYKISNPDDIIVYIEQVTAPNNNVPGNQLKSNTYYFLGKDGVTYSFRSDAWYTREDIPLYMIRKKWIHLYIPGRGT